MRIVAIGPSDMYGQGLEDCVGENNVNVCGPSPSKFAYPSLASAHYNCECINLAEPGISNLNILLKIYEFDFRPGDIALIEWVVPTTGALLQDDNSSASIHPWMAEDYKVISKHPLFDSLMTYESTKANMTFKQQMDSAKKFYELHSNRHLTTLSWIFMDAGAMHLDRLDIPHAFATGEYWDPQYCPHTTDYIDFSGPGDFIDYGLDGSHPGPLQHKVWAEETIKAFDKLLNK